MAKSSVQVEIWNSATLAENLKAVAELRIQVFKDFPYLYEGSLEYEKNYLKVYLESPRSLFVAVKDQRTLVGLSSAIPLIEETDPVKAPFQKAGLNLSEIFYFGESVLLNPYRGLGLGHRFFDEREKGALSFGTFKRTCFCAVERPKDHPRRPQGYQPLHEFWKKRGYQIKPELQTHFLWTDIGETHETPKTMTFWMKELVL